MSAPEHFRFETAPLATESLPLREGRMRPVQRATAGLVVALPLLAAIPVGSNRPVFWLVWSAVLGLAGAAYLWLHARHRPGLALHASAWLPLFVLWLLFAAVAMIQSLPLGGVLPDGLLALTPVAEELLPAQPAISIAPEASRLSAIRLAGYAILALLVLQTAARADRTRVMAWALFLGITAHAIWGMVSLRMLEDGFFWGEKTAYLGAATGTFINRNSFASFLGVGLVLGVALLLERSTRRRIRQSHRPGPLSAERVGDLAVGGCLLLILVALLSTQSRMGFVATLLGLGLCLVLMRLKQGGSRLWLLLLGGFAALGIAAVSLLLFGGELIDRAIFIESASVERGQLYRQVLDMIADRPWLGFGSDAFEPAFQIYQRPPLSPLLTWEDAHST